jgi:N-methylhydantoinase A
VTAIAAPLVVGIDTGGTFTDFVVWRAGQVHVHKVLSIPAAPEQAIVQGLQELALLPTTTARLRIVHGSTVATNAVLEGKGVRTAYITNHGLGDVLTIGRQTRRELYNLQPAPVAPPVPAALCLETGGRIAANGEVIEPLTDAALQHLRTQLQQLAPQSVAINLVFSFVDARFERQIEAIVPAGIFVTRSSAILPEYKEYERGMTTWLNAYVGPLMQGYLARLCAAVPQAQISVMQSSGGTIAAEHAGARAVHLLLSGPAGGLAAAQYIGTLTQQLRLLTFDMGGTSTDVAMIDGDLPLSHEGRIANYPVAVPMVDLHTIGAGGGSIAFVDAGGVLQVGPQSAGADPGPACYGRGGTFVTVTDANLVLGRLRADAFLGGRMQLDHAAAQAAMQRLATQLHLSVAETALGVVRIVNEHMAQALRVMSVQRGIDPRQLTLMSFGGAGGLHVCALAEALGMTRAMVPIHAGVLSALGMLVAPRARQLSHTATGLLDNFRDAAIETLLAPLAAQGRQALVQEGVDPALLQSHCSLDLRYQGQAYTLNVPWVDVAHSAAAFHRRHEQRYGHALNVPIELVTVRVALSARADDISLPKQTNAASVTPQPIHLYGVAEPVPLYERHALPMHAPIDGPALIVETVATTYLAPGWQLQQDEYGNLLLHAAN